MNKQPSDESRVQIVKQETVYQGYFQIEAYHLRHRTHEGGWTPELHFELFERGRTAVVLPYDAVLDQVVLIEQFRIGAYASGGEPWLAEAVAGRIEPDETAEDAVRREAMEEAGCEVTDLHPIGSFLLTPGACSEACTMFCGRVDASNAGGVHGVAEEGEDIRVIATPAEEAIARAMNGDIASSYGAIPLLWLASNRDMLRAKWS
jgi:ADP-ribose pyrophosphatase